MQMNVCSWIEEDLVPFLKFSKKKIGLDQQDAKVLHNQTIYSKQASIVSHVFKWY